MSVIIEGDCLERLKDLPDESVDVVLTDPPYGYSFMNRDWDRAVPSVEIWQECLRVLKPGAFACVMSAPRSDVQQAMTERLIRAGFRLDFTPIYWTYASGFPKAGNIGKLVDKRNGRDPEQYRALGQYLRELRGSTPQKEISKHFPSKTGGLTGCVANWELGLNVPTAEQWITLKTLLPIDSRFDELIEREEAQREVIGQRKAFQAGNGGTSYAKEGGWASEVIDETLPSTDQAKALDGSYAGFQPKPALEVCITARKPLSKQQELTIITSQLIEVLSWLNVQLAANSSSLHQTVKDSIVPRLATGSTDEEVITQAGQVAELSGQMDILRSTLAQTTADQFTSWNIVTLWQGILADLLRHMNKYTTETMTALITDLRTLNYLLSTTIPDNTTQANETTPSGFQLNVDIVESVLRSVLTKSLSPSQATAQKSAGSKNLNGEEVRPASGAVQTLEVTTRKESIAHSPATPHLEVSVAIIAMKPLSEKTYVDQALKNGKGVSWLDDGRIPLDANAHKDMGTFRNAYKQGAKYDSTKGSVAFLGKETAPNIEAARSGRFPANLLVSDDVLNDGKITKSIASIRRNKSGMGIHDSEKGTFGKGDAIAPYADSGSYSRYFDLDSWARERLPAEQAMTFPFAIFPKASKSEKNRGLNRFNCAIIEVCNEDNMELAISHLKAILESIPNLSIDVSGSTLTVQSPMDCMSTTLTMISQIIESKTYTSSMRSHTSDSMRGVLSKTTPGTSPAKSVESSSESTKITGTSQEKAGLVTDAVSSVTYQRLLTLSDASAWKPNSNIHPTCKPVRLMSYLITLFSREGDTVLDPFVGSGTTVVAAEQLGRKGIGIEREAEYAEIARARLAHIQPLPDEKETVPPVTMEEVLDSKPKAKKKVAADQMSLFDV